MSKTYISARTGETIEALRDVSFRVEPHEFVAIVGPSGCGKRRCSRWSPDSRSRHRARCWWTARE